MVFVVLILFGVRGTLRFLTVLIWAVAISGFIDSSWLTDYQSPAVLMQKDDTYMSQLLTSKDL